MKKIELSIIVPVYNCEKYINRCVNSILNQKLKNIQLILIDDGSKDSSGNICDKYAAIDSRVLVIHNQNQGVSMARNCGLSAALGEYIGFVDADDWIDIEMYSTLIGLAKENNADIVMCDALTEYSNKKNEIDTISQLSKSCILKKNDYYPKLLMEIAGSACRCIYKSSVIRDNNIVFDTKLKFSEDRVFNIYSFGYADVLYYLKKPFYHRIIQNKSAVHRFHIDYFERVNDALSATQKALYDAWDDDHDFKVAYLEQYINGVVASIRNYFYKTSTLTFKEKYKKLVEICNCGMVYTAIKNLNRFNRIDKWIYNKNYINLIIYAILSNKKYKC